MGNKFRQTDPGIYVTNELERQFTIIRELLFLFVVCSRRTQTGMHFCSHLPHALSDPAMPTIDDFIVCAAIQQIN